MQFAPISTAHGLGHVVKASCIDSATGAFEELFLVRLPVLLFCPFLLF